MLPALIDGLRPRHVVADAAYDSLENHGLIEQAGGRGCIKPHRGRNTGRTHDPVAVQAGGT